MYSAKCANLQSMALLSQTLFRHMWVLIMNEQMNASPVLLSETPLVALFITQGSLKIECSVVPLCLELTCDHYL